MLDAVISAEHIAVSYPLRFAHVESCNVLAHTGKHVYSCNRGLPFLHTHTLAPRTAQRRCSKQTMAVNGS